MGSNEDSDEGVPSVAERTWQSLRDGVEWVADTFRGHAHVREMKNERE